jgi:hypothetical protein
VLPSGRTTRRMITILWAVAVVVLRYGEAGLSTPLSLLDLEGREVDPLQQTDAKATVFLFTRTDCPIANRYTPELQRLQAKFRSDNVRFWLVYPDPDESVNAIREHVKEYGYHWGVLRDPQHRLVSETQVQVTPEVAVFVPGRRMVYRGRVDDRYVDFGKARAKPTQHDLEQALQAILEGRPVDRDLTPAVGCFIPDLQ